MLKVAILTAILVLMFTVIQSMAGEGQTGKKDGPALAHMVYFSLKDNSPAEVQKLVEACKKYLSRHDGEVYFAVGTVNKDLKRDVNDLDFDVSLMIVFSSREAHDVYQEHPRHKQFIAENKANWKKVRVFDSNVSR